MINPIDRDLRRYYADEEAEDAKNDAINARAKELFAGEYRHDMFAAISEAIGEASAEDAAAIDSALKTGNLAQLGRMLVHVSAAYWFSRALKKAESEINEIMRSRK